MDVLTRGAHITGSGSNEADAIAREFLFRDLIEPAYIRSEEPLELSEDVQLRQQLTASPLAGIGNESLEGGFAISTATCASTHGGLVGPRPKSDLVSQMPEPALWERPTLHLNGSASERSGPRSLPDNACTGLGSTRRARNAANCRHGKSTSSKRATDQLRERNRIAAAKHRIKKKATTEGMSDDLQNMRSTNMELKRECLELRNQLSYWRMHALQHISGQDGCQCNTIHQYNANQACELVLGVEKSEKELHDVQMLEPSIV